MNRADFFNLLSEYQTLFGADQSAQTRRTYGNAIKRLLAFVESRPEAEPVSSKTLLQWKNALQKETGANTTAQYLRITKTILNRMREISPEGGAFELKVPEIPKKKRPDYNLLSIEEIEQILVAPEVKSKMQTRGRAILILLLLTGLRNAELRNLRRTDLDFNRKQIKVREGKGGKDRIVAFPETAQEAVRDYLKAWREVKRDMFLFGSTADENGHNGRAAWHPISGQDLLGIVNRYTEKICGHKVGVHALRHGTAAYLDYAGVPIRTVQKNLGHSNLTTTENVYYYVLQADQAARSIADILDGTETA